MSPAPIVQAVNSIVAEREKNGDYKSFTDFCERIRVDETVICDEKLLEYADSLKGRIRSIPVKQGGYVSPVGIILALAFSWFREENTKVHVLECGKGVRYDDTRNIKHDYSIVTPVFKEHTRELGKTIEEIAGDKSRNKSMYF